MAEGQRAESPYLIVGAESLVLALDRALKIIGFCQGCVVSADDSQLCCEELETRILEVLPRTAPSTLIHLVFGSDLPGTVIRAVHFFRSRLLWDGSYVAIVANDRECEAVAQSNLIGTKATSGVFSVIPGHHVLQLPVTLSTVSRIIQELRPMYVEEWWKLLDSTGVMKFFSELRDLSTEHPVGRGALSRRLESMFRCLSEIEWWWFVKDHQSERVVRELLVENERPGTRDSRSPSDVLKDLRQAFPQGKVSA